MYKGATETTVAEVNDQPPVIALKAALLIQNWYRRCQARLEARRRASWNIFTALEYSGEQDQLKVCERAAPSALPRLSQLHNFFTDIMNAVIEAEHQGEPNSLLNTVAKNDRVSKALSNVRVCSCRRRCTHRVHVVLLNPVDKDKCETNEAEFLAATNPNNIVVEKGYKGPHLTFPLKKHHVDEMMEWFKKKQVCTRYVRTAWMRSCCTQNMHWS
jgi:serine/threonine-protein phosphatase with EF-hand domain